MAVPTADDMHALGRRVGSQARPGDLIVVDGVLGAGKTTFAQGVGAAMDVRGPVTSPTFVIARVHPSQHHGLDLVHVDAYRLQSLTELDELDLDTALDESVTVVEWGQGMAEVLSDERLELVIARSDNESDEERTVELLAVGERWVDAMPRLVS